MQTIQRMFETYNLLRQYAEHPSFYVSSFFQRNHVRCGWVLTGRLYRINNHCRYSESAFKSMNWMLKDGLDDIRGE